MGVKRNASNDDGGTTNVSYAFLNTVLSARSMLARGLGMMFSGKRDLYDTFGYTSEVTYEAMLARYKRQDIVSRIVNAYPDAVWTRPPEIIDNDALGEGLQKLNQQVGLYHYINRADRLAGIGKYSVLLLGFDDVSRTEDMEKPVRGSELQPVNLVYLQAYGYGAAKVREYEDNVASPWFGLPRIYELSVKVGETGADGGMDARGVDGVGKFKKVRVHRSRVLHLADCVVDNEVEGYPILERVFNRLDDLEKVVGGSSEIFWLSGRKGMQIDVDKDTQFTSKDAENLRKEIDEYVHELSRVIRTRGVSVKELGGHSINPGPVFNVIMSVISVTTGIPQRIFIGSEQGKLASEQDRANWAIRIDERRVLYAEPMIFRPLIARLQAFGVLPEGSYGLQWPEAFRLSPLERAQTAAQQARAAVNVSRAMVDYSKPIEGVDYPKYQTVPGTGTQFAPAAGGKKVAAAASPATTKGKSGKDAVPTPDNGGKAGDAVKVEPPDVNEIQVTDRELISREEARAIIFARGELKTEGKIDGIMD